MPIPGDACRAARSTCCRCVPSPQRCRDRWVGSHECRKKRTQGWHKWPVPSPIRVPLRGSAARQGARRPARACPQICSPTRQLHLPTRHLFLTYYARRAACSRGGAMTTVITQEDASAINWYRELTPVEKRTFWACFGGWALDAMDVQIFSFVIPAIIIAFAITNADAGLIGTVTLLTSAFGGWFAGALVDRFGRVRTLQITILWFAFFTLLCGFAQNYTQLLVFRALMGFGFGGEWAAGAVLMGEVIRAQHSGKAVGSVQSGWAIGWAVAAAMATLFFSVLPQDTAWRALFWVGVAPAFFVFFVRRFVEEPPVYKVTLNKLAETGRRAKFTEFFSPGILTTTILTSLLTTGAQGGYYAIFTWLPTFLRTERKLTVLGTGGHSPVVFIGPFA